MTPRAGATGATAKTASARTAKADEATAKADKAAAEAAGADAATAVSGKQVTYREAMREALREALIRDERVFIMGEDVGRYGGCYAVTLGLLEEFGPERIRDTPLSESAFVGAGIGAALAGMRPIVEIMTVNFSLLALDQIVNNAATLLHMSGGQLNVPLVIRMTTGPAARSPRSTHTAWKGGTRTSPACGSWHLPRSPMPAACCGPRWKIPTRC